MCIAALPVANVLFALKTRPMADWDHPMNELVESVGGRLWPGAKTRCIVDHFVALGYEMPRMRNS